MVYTPVHTFVHVWEINKATILFSYVVKAGSKYHTCQYLYNVSIVHSTNYK